MTEPAPGAPANTRGVQVWDLPIRVVHWSIVILVPAAWWTAHHDQLDVHRLIGVTVAGLVIFRLVWGVVGGRTARFAAFVKGPREVFAYARGLLDRAKENGAPGHNPMGGWSVVALLTLLVVETGLGLFSVDVDGEASGPLANRISFDAGRLAAKLHHQAFNVLLALIGLHLAAILFYLAVRRDNLVGPMVTGRRRAAAHGAAQAPMNGAPLAEAPLWRFGLAAAAGLGAALILARGLSTGL